MIINIKNVLITVITLVIVFNVNAKNISQNELSRQMKSNDKLVIIDVRTVEEYSARHIPGAINIPHLQIKTRMNEILAFKDKDIVLYCRSGRRAVIAKDNLMSGGVSTLTHLEGDFNAWTANKMPTENGSSQKLDKLITQ
jgi:rhodanese-related sulfurtransferase